MLRSKVIGVDNGDICLDVDKKQLASGGISLGDSINISIGEHHLQDIPLHSGPYCKMFSTVLIADGKTTHLSIRRGNALEKYPTRVGQAVTIDLKESKRFWEKENAYSFDEIKVKLPQQDMESFANFRPLFSKGKVFFRSSSPFDDAYGRAHAVVSCIEKHNIKTIIDMADSKEDFANLFRTLNSTTQKKLASCHIFPIGDDFGLYSKEFEKSIISAVKIMAISEGPFLLHCRAGKRRSGFLCAVLQGLAGMSAGAIKNEYMISYENNNGVVRANNPARYDYLCDDTIGRILSYINGRNLANLPKTTTNYLLKIGLKPKIIRKVRSKLINDKASE